MEQNHLEALRMLYTFSPRFDVWALAGDHNSGHRQALMTILNGHKTPRAKSGVGAITEAFYAIAKPEGNCIAVRERSFATWARTQLGIPQPPERPSRFAELVAQHA